MFGIAACNNNGVIGDTKKNGLIWKHSIDLQVLKAFTQGRHLIGTANTLKCMNKLGPGTQSYALSKRTLGNFYTIDQLWETISLIYYFPLAEAVFEELIQHPNVRNLETLFLPSTYSFLTTHLRDRFCLVGGPIAYNTFAPLCRVFIVCRVNDNSEGNILFNTEWIKHLRKRETLLETKDYSIYVFHDNSVC